MARRSRCKKEAFRINYALKKAIEDVSFVLIKVPDKVDWLDFVEQNRVRRLLKIQFMDNHLSTTEITQ
jgi:hypothetical protein